MDLDRHDSRKLGTKPAGFTLGRPDGRINGRILAVSDERFGETAADRHELMDEADCLACNDHGVQYVHAKHTCAGLGNTKVV